MLDNISGKFNKVFKYLKGEAKITEDNMKAALREIKLSLLEADVNFKVVKSFIENIRTKSFGREVQESLSPYQQVIKIVKSELENILGSKNQRLNQSSEKPSVIMLVGLQGTGKTTTAGKLALHLKGEGKTSMLCSLDLKRLAAGEQLQTIANEIGINYFSPNKTSGIKGITKEVLKHAKEYGYDYLIADTAGRLHLDNQLMSELKEIKDLLKPAEVIFVADSLTGQDAVNSALNFSQQVGIDSIILTKLDADSRGGAALSIVSVTNKPIKFIGIGEKYQDFQLFYPDRLASKILGMGDILTLIEKTEKEYDEKKVEDMARKMMKNEFSLSDFKDQMKQMQKLGPISDIMGMMPKMGMGFDQKAAESALDDKKICHTIAIINSMTKKERYNPKILNGKRRSRIAKGSGRSVQEVNQLLKNFYEMKKFMKKPFFRKLIKKVDFSSKIL